MPWDPLSPWPRARRWLWAALAAFVCLVAGPSFVLQLRPPADGNLAPPDDGRADFANGSGDFFQEWASARNRREGLPVYAPHRVTLERYLGHRVRPDGALLVEVNAHPPTSVLLALPGAGLPYPDALLAWNLLSLGALAVSLWLVVRGLGVPFSAWALFPLAVVLLLCYPLREQVIQGQLNLVLLLLLTGTWAAERSGRPGWAGVLVGAATAIKLFPGFLLVYFVLRRQWKALAAAALALAGLTLLTAAVLGAEAYRAYVRDVLPEVAWFRAGWNNASLAGFWSKLFDPAPEKVRPWWQTEPLFYSPLLARAGYLASCSVVVALLAWASSRARTPAGRDLAFGLALVAMLLVAPVAWEHYFLLLLLPLALVWLTLPPRPGARALFLGVFVCLWLVPPVLLSSVFVPGGHPFGTAGPAQALTVLSVQTYALLALFGLGLAAAAREARSAGVATEERAAYRPAGREDAVAPSEEPSVTVGTCSR